MNSKGREYACRVAAVLCIAAMTGCTLDSMGRGSLDSTDDAGVADVISSDTSVPEKEAGHPDTSVSDASDGGKDSETPDVAVVDTGIPDSAEPDTSVGDAPDSSVEDVSDALLADVTEPEPGEDAIEEDEPEQDVFEASVPTVESMSVASDSLTVDRVRGADGAIAADGLPDGAFVVSVYGEIVGLALISTDASGAPSGGQQWDTYVGAAAIPSEVGAGYTVGSATWQLGVWEGAAPLNASDGSLAPVALGSHSLQLYGANSGYFGTGSHFRVIVELAGGAIIRGPVVTY